MKTTTPSRFIRWLLAQTGADPNQSLPPARRPVRITVEKHGDTHVAIIRTNGRYNNEHLVDYTNIVYLIGEVEQVVDGKEEVKIVTDATKRLIRVCAAPRLPKQALCRLREGDLIVIVGKLDGECVRATKLHCLNTEPRERIYG
jgi:hypothetical protein